MRAGLSELRTHCTEGGEKGRAGGCAQEVDLGKSSRGKARGGLEGSEPPREARTRAPAPPPLRSPRWSGLCSPVPPRPPLLRSPVSSLSPARNHLGPHIGDLPAVPNTCLPAVLKPSSRRQDHTGPALFPPPRRSSSRDCLSLQSGNPTSSVSA